MEVLQLSTYIKEAIGKNLSSSSQEVLIVWETAYNRPFKAATNEVKLHLAQALHFLKLLLDKDISQQTLPSAALQPGPKLS